MTLMATGNVVADRQLDHSSVVVNELPIATIAGNISLYVGTGLSNARQVEIIESWLWLMQGIRERRLLNVGVPGTFYQSPLYTVVDINNRTTVNRRTSSLFTELTANDIGIGMSLEATGLFTGYVVPIETAFLQLIEEAKVALLVAA